jgi:hypothetical protein
MDLSCVFDGSGEQEQASYRERIIEYVDSVFIEVRLSDKAFLVFGVVSFIRFDSGCKID